MKRLILPLFLVCFNLLAAQNYQNICSPGITFYKNTANSMLAFRRDSVLPTGNNDTIFVSYRAIRANPDTICLDTTNGSILGRSIYKTHTGWFYFFNKVGDTIKINTQAVTDQTWKFCPLPNNGYIEAKIIYISTESVLGFTDAVKTIMFQAKDAGNNNIAHDLNQKYITLSQHYGFSRMLDIYQVPDDTVAYIIAGKSLPVLGIQNLTWHEIYNFSVGDEFHYTSYATTAGSSKILRVLNKTSFGADSVGYLMEECQKMYTATPPFYSTLHDTISVNYSLRENQQDNWISRLPGEFVRSGSSADIYSYSESQYKGRRQKGISYGGNTFSTYPLDTILCWKGYSYYESIAGFTDGLGKTRTYWYQAEPPYVYEWDEELVYYKKGSVSWGTPVASDCFVLVNVESKLADLYSRVDVVPNPAETSVQITLHGFLPDDHPGYSLYNYSGIRVLAGKAITNPFVISRGGLHSGLYILTINDENGMIRGKTKIFFQ